MYLKTDVSPSRGNWGYNKLPVDINHEILCVKVKLESYWNIPRDNSRDKLSILLTPGSSPKLGPNKLKSQEDCEFDDIISNYHWRSSNVGPRRRGKSKVNYRRRKLRTPVSEALSEGQEWQPFFVWRPTETGIGETTEK